MKKKKMIRIGLFVFLMSFLSCSIVTAAEKMSEQESCSQSSEEKEIVKLAMVELEKYYSIRGFAPEAYLGREFWSKEKSKLEKKCEELYPDNYSLSLQKLKDQDLNHFDQIIIKNNYDEYHSALHLNYLFFTSLDGINSLCFFEYLKELCISHSKLQAIEPSFFKVCVCLNKLDLSHNEFKEINAEMFIDLSALRTLNLSYNKIENIGQQTFINLSILHFLDLSHNKLEQITSGQFEGLYNQLYELNLSNNQLKTLYAEEILSIKGLGKLDIEGNLLAVDDELFEKLKEKLGCWATGFSCLDRNPEVWCTPSSDDELSDEEEESSHSSVYDDEEINPSLSISEGQQSESVMGSHTSLLEETESGSSLPGGQQHRSVPLVQQPGSVMESILSFPVNHPLITAGTVSAVLVGAAIVSRDPAKARRAAEGMRNRCVIS